MKALVLTLLVFIVKESNSQTQFWEPTNGPYGGGVVSLQSNAGGMLFAGTDNAGLFRSSNHGESWTRVSSSFMMSAVRSLAVNSFGHVFAAAEGRGVQRSTDNGDTWERVDSAWQDDSPTSIAIDANNNIYVGTTLAIYRSTNNGSSWSRISTVFLLPRSILVHPNGYLFVGTYAYGIYRSTDSGATWSQINNGLYSPYVNVIRATPTGVLIAAANGGTFRSTNNGDLWTEVGIENANGYSLAVNAQGKIFVGSFDGAFRSTDDGVTWVRTIRSGRPVRAIHTVQDREVFLGSGRHGVYRSSDGGDNWQISSVGLSNSSVIALAVDLNGRLFAGVDGGEVQYSQNRGDSWQYSPVTFYTPTIGSFVINAQNVVFAGSVYRTADQTGVYRSTNHGVGWEPSGILNFGINALAVNSLDHIYAASERGLFLSTDIGTTWTRLVHILTDTLIKSVVVDANDNVFVVTRAGVSRSTDNGYNWFPVNQGLPLQTINSIWSDRNGRLYVGVSPGVYKSTDAGTTWNASGLSSMTIATIVTNSLGHVFAANWGVYRSTDFGTTWSDVNTGLTDIYVQALAVDMHGYLYAGTDRGGVYRSRGSTTGIDEPYRVRPGAFSLSQNYPNPFNPSTRIEYAIPRTSHALLKVFDVLGREVATLVDEVQDSGSKTLTFDASALASGVYFYCLKAGTLVDTKKLMFIR